MSNVTYYLLIFIMACNNLLVLRLATSCINTDNELYKLYKYR